MPITTQQIIPLAYLRLYQIVGDRKRGIDSIIPISKSSFLRGVKDGRFPSPDKLGVRTVAWKSSDIANLLISFGGKK